MTEKKKLLEVCLGSKPVSGETFPEIEDRAHMDIWVEHKPRYLYDIREESDELLEEIGEKFDVVFAPHILEQTPRSKVLLVMKNMIAALKEGGELYIVTHDLGWIAEDFTADNPSTLAHHMLFGSEKHPHMNAFKMIHLRKLIEDVDLVVRKAYRQLNRMTSEEENVDFYKNIIIAAKVTE